MIYTLGRHIVRFSVRQFFSSIKLSGAAICEEGPVLFVCNHPNFALDSLVVQSVIKRELWFLAKATLFRGRFLRWFLKQCHMVPVYRRQDDAKQMGRNLETFRVAASTLQRNSALVIFPEGVSKGERQLAPIKSGAARIALQAEMERSFSLGLKIQAVGLTYTDLRSFQSGITVCFSEPIKVSEYADHYHGDAVKTVDLLTARIEDQLRDVSVHLANLEHQVLVESIGKLFESGGTSSDDRLRLATIARNVEQLSPFFSEKRQALESRLGYFIEFNKLLGLEPGQLLRRDMNLKEGVYELLIAPLVICGILLHWMPYRLIGSLVDRYCAGVGLASYKFALGCFIFPLWWILLGLAALFLGAEPPLLLLIVMLAVLSAYFANKHHASARLLLLSALWPGKRKPLDLLLIMRDDLVRELEQLRVE